MNRSKNMGIVIQARISSTRLPGKVLTDFCGRPMLQFQIDLLKGFNLGMEIVVATTEENQDNVIVEFCSSKNIPCVRGSEKNVIDRYCGVAKKWDFEHIIRLTADNPLPNYRVIMGALNLHLGEKPDLTSTRRIEPDGTITRFIPKGFSVDIINCSSLLAIDQNRLSDFAKEHVIPAFFNNKYRVSLLQDMAIPAGEWSVDTGEDLQRVAHWAATFEDIQAIKRWLGYRKNGIK